MDGFLKQSTAHTFRAGPFVDSTDGVTAETALTIAQADIQISKAGGAFAQTSDASPTTTHDADGYYQCPLTTTDTGTVGNLKIQIAMTGAAPVWHTFVVLPANVYDSMVAGTDNLDINVTQWLGTAAATPTTAGVPEVDVTYWLGTAAATPTVAGVPEVDVTHWIGTAAATPDTAGIPMVNVEEVGGTTQTPGDIIGSLPTEADNNGILLIDTVTSISSDTVTLTSPGVTTDDQFNNCPIILLDVSTNENWSGYVVDSVASGNTIVLNENPATAVGWTPASTDLVRVYPKTKADFEIGSAVNATISADIAAVKTETASILADTATLGTPAGADFAADIAAVKSDTAAILTDTGTTIPAQIGTPVGADISADIAAVKSDTAAILTDTGTTIPAQIGTPVNADISADIAAVKTDTAAVKVVTDLIANAAGTYVDGTVDTVTNTHTPTTTEFQADDITEATADHFKDRVIIFTSGALQYQAKAITAYSLVGGIGQFTTNAFTEAPANNDTFIIL